MMIVLIILNDYKIREVQNLQTRTSRQRPLIWPYHPKFGGMRSWKGRVNRSTFPRKITYFETHITKGGAQNPGNYLGFYIVKWIIESLGQHLYYRSGSDSSHEFENVAV